MEDGESRAGDWLGASHDEEGFHPPEARGESSAASSRGGSAAEPDARGHAPALREWSVAADAVSFAGSAHGGHAQSPRAPGADAGSGPFADSGSPESALALLNERIDRIEGLIAGELSVRLQDALAQMPTQAALAQAVSEAVETATTEVVGKAVEPLVEAVAQLQAQHEEEMQRREEEHRSDVERLVERFNALGDEMARHNALTEEQIARLQERKGRWWWPWSGGS